jgi:hypothetical protein
MCVRQHLEEEQISGGFEIHICDENFYFKTLQGSGLPALFFRAYKWFRIPFREKLDIFQEGLQDN